MTTLKEKYAKWEEYMFEHLEEYIKIAHDKLEKAMDSANMGGEVQLENLRPVDDYLFEVVELMEDAEAYYNKPTGGN